MPLFKVKSPGNVNAFNEFFTDTANFEVQEFDSVSNDLFYIPEEDPVSVNFQNAGHESYMMITNLGLKFYMMLAWIGIIVIHFLLYLLSKAIARVGKVKSVVADRLYWNGSIRFFIEGYFDFVLLALLNL